MTLKEKEKFLKKIISSANAITIIQPRSSSEDMASREYFGFSDLRDIATFGILYWLKDGDINFDKVCEFQILSGANYFANLTDIRDYYDGVDHKSISRQCYHLYMQYSRRAMIEFGSDLNVKPEYYSQAANIMICLFLLYDYAESIGEISGPQHWELMQKDWAEVTKLMRNQHQIWNDITHELLECPEMILTELVIQAPYYIDMYDDEDSLEQEDD